ncbi:MAG: aminotransferase class V-fold PLP-dependent enzyme [Polyangiaceae bacterium]|nr:aminotransferase class V-fold PLP-dependent enzyme [Polyangiaceae bacterium]
MDRLERSVGGEHWGLDPKVTFLNHGSFGACPKPILEHQSRLRAEIEAQPVRFFQRFGEEMMDETRHMIGALVGAPEADIACVSSASAAVSTVLRSLSFSGSDEILVSDHEYGATRNAVDFAADRAGASVKVVHLPFPLKSADEITEAVLGAITQRTRLVVLDHITSMTGLILPIQAILDELNRRGIDSLIDGAHAPGMIPLDVEGLNPTYYAGNFHKWLCAPKGSAFLYVRLDAQAQVRPLVISHGASSIRKDRSKFRLEADWIGTLDPTPWLCVPKCIEFLSTILPGGFRGLQRRNHRLTLVARDLLCESLEIDAPCPDSMLGTLASVPLPDAVTLPSAPLFFDSWQDRLFHDHQIEVPILSWPQPPSRLLRISAQAYNRRPQYVKLSKALGELLRESES